MGIFSKLKAKLTPERKYSVRDLYQGNLLLLTKEELEAELALTRKIPAKIGMWTSLMVHFHIDTIKELLEFMDSRGITSFYSKDDLLITKKQALAFIAYLRLNGFKADAALPDSVNKRAKLFMKLIKGMKSDEYVYELLAKTVTLEQDQKNNIKRKRPRKKYYFLEDLLGIDSLYEDEEDMDDDEYDDDDYDDYDDDDDEDDEDDDNHYAILLNSYDSLVSRNILAETFPTEYREFTNSSSSIGKLN